MTGIDMKSRGLFLLNLISNRLKTPVGYSCQNVISNKGSSFLRISTLQIDRPFDQNTITGAK